MEDTLKLGILEDHHGFRSRMVSCFESYPEWSVVGAYSNPMDALKGLPGSRAQLVLVDYHLPGLSGVDVLTQLKLKSPQTKYLILTVDDRTETIIKAFEGGADGYLIKGQSMEELVKSIRNFLKGDVVMSPSVARRLITWFQPPAKKVSENLTARQWEILRLASQGKQQGEIALLLNLSLHTVKNHFRNIYQKLQVHTLRDALIKLRRGRHLLNE